MSVHKLRRLSYVYTLWICRCYLSIREDNVELTCDSYIGVALEQE